MADQVERRKSERKKYPVKDATIFAQKEEGDPCQCRVVNISEGGMCLDLQSGFITETDIKLRINDYFTDLISTFNATHTVEVIWLRQTESSQTQTIGCKFIKFI